jgi:hypothetical protein
MTSIIPSVKQLLKNNLKESMLVAFPLSYGKKKIEDMLHIGAAWHLPQKKCDYFSTSGELIFRKNVKKDEESGAYEKGYYGLPSPMEVS